MSKLIGKHTGDVPGTLKEYAGGVVQPGYLACDASLQLIATYSVLFSKIGHAWNGGVDPGGGQFRIPGSAGRGTIGAGSYTDPVSGVINRVLGASAGAEKHLISSAEMAAHNHTASSSGAGAHSHVPAVDGGVGSLFAVTQFAGAVTAGGASFAGVNGRAATTDTTPNHAHGVTVDNSTGGGSSHNNMQPYMVVTRMIKY